MIKFWFRCSIILWMVVATCYAHNMLKCPANCSCNADLTSDFQIYCPAGINSNFVVNFYIDRQVTIVCNNSPQWTQLRLSNFALARDTDGMRFESCDLPTNSSLGEIANSLGAFNIKKLDFRSFGDLKTNLTEKHLEGFPKLDYLVLASNGFTNLSRDLFANVPNLTTLNLRDNDLRSLPSGIFNNTSKLEVLELGQNAMSTVEPDTFDSLKKLTLLNFWSNRLVELELHTFDQLESLMSLDLHDNNLTTLPKDIFAKLKKLQVLNLSMNNFSLNGLPEGLLQHNVKLKEIKLYSNKRNMTSLPRGFFANLTELRMVELKSSGLIRVPEDIFRACVSLENISIQRNYLISLPKRLFEGLRNLTVLEINFNELRSLPDGIFSHLFNLKTLDLSKNHITSISRGLFRDLKSLRFLKMHENELKEIEQTSFDNLGNLRVAMFSNNKLSFDRSPRDIYGSISPFNKCLFLEELHLDKNNITSIFSDWMLNFVHLKLLDLRYNQISFIEAQSLQFLTNKINVDLRYNEIKSIYLWQAETIAKTNHQMEPKDVIIEIENNPLICDCYIYDFLRYLEGEMHPYVQNYFHIKPGNLTCRSPYWLENIPVTRLKSKSFKCQVTDYCPEECTCYLIHAEQAFLVDCSHKNLKTVPRNITIYPGFTTLELDLTDNELTELDNDLPDVSISKLLLSNNSIVDISVNQIPQTLQDLELHNNRISKLSSNVLDLMSNMSLTSLTLHGNPWTCNCDTRDFLVFITKTRNITDSSQITCEGETSPMIKMLLEDVCPTHTTVIVALSTTIAITGLIIGLLAALYYRYQLEIKVWLYSRGLCLWFVTEDELDKNKLYDAFISYSHKDEEFVNELVSKLESSPVGPYKLCVHYRDWVPGEFVADQIVHSVEDSRRTVVILSPNFLQSEWARMEWKTAHCRALAEKRTRVIIILYGDIGPLDSLDVELQAYLKMNTYVNWGDPWFWGKLRYALPHPPELVRRNQRVRRKIFEKSHPCLQVNGDKKELITSNGIPPETPPAATTPPISTQQLFICDENNEIDRLSPLQNNTKFILSPEELLKNNNLMNKVQSTTVC